MHADNADQKGLGLTFRDANFPIPLEDGFYNGSIVERIVLLF